MTLPLIHIGYHKTGTTWLQREVFCRQDLGFCAPWGHQSHEAIEQFVLQNPFSFNAYRTREVFKHGLEDASHSGLIPVVTQEDLCGYPVYGRYYGKEVAERLAAVFPGAKIVIGIREQKAAILSHYRQYVRQGEAGSLRSFIGSGDEPTGFSPICRLDHFEYHLLVGHYRSLFGAENVLVMPIELLRGDPDNYFQMLLKFIDLSPSPAPVAQAANVGWGGVTLEAKRFFNGYRIGLADWKNTSQPVSYFLVHRLCSVIDAVVPKAWHKLAEQSMKDLIAQRCEGYFECSNSALADITGLNLGDLGYSV